MSRMVSFFVLLAVLVLIAFLFYRVMAGFLLPMFLAVLLAVIFRPLYDWFLKKYSGRGRLAAGLTTGTIVLIVLLPLLLILTLATKEGVKIYSKLGESTGDTAVETSEVDSTDEGAKTWIDKVIDQKAIAQTLVEFGAELGLSLEAEDVETNIRQKVPEWLAPIAMNAARFSGNLVLGMFVMVISLYYFLADGPWMIGKIMHYSPLDDEYERQLVDEFAKMSRAVVLATLLSALAQGLLAGIGYQLTGIDAVFLLTGLTMLFAMVPFVGAAAVWIPVSAWLFFFEERHMAGILLAIYGGAVVSMADNVIKPMVLHGRSNLHPLLALLSVLGGVQALGPIGIFVGPMVVAFLHALLNMFHKELERISNGTNPSQDIPLDHVEKTS